MMTFHGGRRNTPKAVKFISQPPCAVAEHANDAQHRSEQLDQPGPAAPAVPWPPNPSQGGCSCSCAMSGFEVPTGVA